MYLWAGCATDISALVTVRPLLNDQHPPIDCEVLDFNGANHGDTPCSAIPAIRCKRKEAKELWLMDTGCALDLISETKAKSNAGRPGFKLGTGRVKK